MYRKCYLGLLFSLVLCSISRGQSCRCEAQEDNAYHQWYVITAPSGLSMRKGPNKNAAKIDAIPFGEEVLACGITGFRETIEDKTGNWLKVTWGDKIGYVFGGFLAEIEERKIRMVIPNAGVNSGWECMELSPEMKWEALVNADAASKMRNDRNPGRFVSADLKLGKKIRDENTDCPGWLNNAVLNMPDPPFAVFSGFKLANMVYNQVAKPVKLLPGEVVFFEIYDRANQVDRIYSIAVEGNIRLNPNYETSSHQGPIDRIEQYKIHLYEEEQVSPRSNTKVTKKAQKLIETTIQRPGDSGSFDMDVYYVYFAGDIDGDNQLDLILATLNGVGYSYHLYLSSKKLPGFLLRYVAIWTDSSC